MSGLNRATCCILLITAVCMGCTSDKGVKTSDREQFHLYLLIGQSNMAGRGVVEDQDRTPNPRVFALNKNNEWVPAVDPIHFDKPIAGVGPGLTFGKIMASYKPGVRIGLIPCAAGGSSISKWKAGEWFEQTNSKPYDDAIKRTQLAMKDGVLKGILWHQGEGDSNEEDAQEYGDRLVLLVQTLRKNLGEPDVPFAAGELATFFTDKNEYAEIVNKGITDLPMHVANTAYVSSKGLTPKEDGVHFDTPSARELGRRYAEAMKDMEK